MRSKGTIGILIVVLLVLFAGCAGCNTYNSLVEQEERVEQAWANVETQYQRRADLIPNLVNTGRGAADFEQETLQSVTEARARAVNLTLVFHMSFRTNLIRLHPRARTIYAGRNFTSLASDPDGFIADGAEHGLFVHETRMLSRYRWSVAVSRSRRWLSQT